MKILIYILILTISQNAFSSEITIDKHLSNAKEWTKAFYANKNDIMSGLQSDSMNKHQKLFKSKLPNQDNKASLPTYKCNSYYINHTVRDNKLNKQFNIPQFGGVSALSSSQSIVKVFIFNECGVEYVEHISAFTLTFNKDSALLDNYNITLSENNKNGYSETQIQTKIESFQKQATQPILDPRTIDFKKQALNIKETLKSQNKSYK
jgi:hypothetical protein